ncbi:uncharacterized protein [Petaurus breviceps papuanus]|uniref:uncharacterized protein n=1 Tax=Petaurus breviceps papuanus TaxID=3040969 RepID=UPI0036DB58A6
MEDGRTQVLGERSEGAWRLPALAAPFCISSLPMTLDPQVERREPWARRWGAWTLPLTHHVTLEKPLPLCEPQRSCLKSGHHAGGVESIEKEEGVTPGESGVHILGDKESEGGSPTSMSVSGPPQTPRREIQALLWLPCATLALPSPDCPLAPEKHGVAARLLPPRAPVSWGLPSLCTPPPGSSLWDIFCQHPMQGVKPGLLEALPSQEVARRYSLGLWPVSVTSSVCLSEVLLMSVSVWGWMG